MRPILIIPGHRNSGASHWQTLWEGNMAYAKRVQMPNWDFPHRGDWVDALDEAIAEANFTAPPMLVAHDIGCLRLEHRQESRGLALDDLVPHDVRLVDAGLWTRQ